MSRVRKIGLLFLGFVLLLLLLILALPVWMPWVAGPVLRGIGVDFGEYERIGYGRFAIREAVFSENGVEVEVDRLEGFVPTVWLWRIFSGEEEREFLLVKDWRVEVGEREKKEETSGGEVSVWEMTGDVENIVAEVVKWMPRARLEEGEVVVSGRSFRVPEIDWKEGRVEGRAIDPELGEELRLAVDLSGGPVSGKIELEPFPLELLFSVERRGEEVRVLGEIGFAGNEGEIEAVFGERGYLPERARIEADRVEVPREYLSVEGYREFSGSLGAEWKKGEFGIRLHVDAEPERADFPEVFVELDAEGDLEKVWVRRLEVESPWLVARLSEPVEYDYAKGLLTEESVFAVVAELSGQPFAEVSGELAGEIRIWPGEGVVPKAKFDLGVKDFAGYRVGVEEILVKGELEWPELRLGEISVSSGERLRIRGEAAADFESRRILSAEIKGEVLGEFVKEWLPEGIDFAGGEFRISAEGDFAEPGHGGRLELSGIRVPGMREMGAGFEWEGILADLAKFELGVLGGGAELRLAGRTAVDFGGKFGELFLEQFRLREGDEPVLESVRGSRVEVGWGDLPVSVSVDQVDWQGPESEVRLSGKVAWPELGKMEGSFRGISADLAAGFVEIDFDRVTVPFLEIRGEWERGPVSFEAAGDVRLRVAEEELMVDVDVSADGDEIRVERLRAVSRGEILVRAEGLLPAAVFPGGERLLVLDEKREFSFRAESSPRRDFWREIGELAGVMLEEPELVLEIGGTLEGPVGKFEAEVGRVRIRQPENLEEPLPEISEVRISVVFDDDLIDLRRLELEVDGQPVSGEAELPMTVADWERLLGGEGFPDWSGISGRILIPETKVAVFSRFAPEVLSPEGELRGEIEVKPGPVFGGEIVLEGVASRPIVPFGALREGRAHLLLEGRSVRIDEISATIGGERVMIDGEIGLPVGQEFGFDLNLRGKNLPLARQTGMVIRGDLDLNARKSGEEEPLISGSVDLHDSFYFAHIRIMPSGALTTPGRRPPFFSVEAEPFAGWRLDVGLRGPGFLEVRGPIFQGTVSADFQLTGTLEEPQAVGAALIEKGRVRFPFAAMGIDQGEIALRPENPFLPQLFIIGSGMTFGYDLQMEVSGTAAEPVLEFSSNPPLTSEQVLLMITTGDLPQDEIQFTTQQRASKFAIYLGQNLLYEITGDDSASDRLLIRSGEQVSEGGKETMVIEYRLTDRWSVLGEYDRFDEYNVGVKWNIYSR